MWNKGSDSSSRIDSPLPAGLQTYIGRTSATAVVRARPLTRGTGSDRFQRAAVAEPSRSYWLLYDLRPAARLWRCGRQLPWQTSRSTTQAWFAGVDHDNLHGAHSRVLEAGVSRTVSELFDGPRLSFSYCPAPTTPTTPRRSSMMSVPIVPMTPTPIPRARAPSAAQFFAFFGR